MFLFLMSSRSLVMMLMMTVMYDWEGIKRTGGLAYASNLYTTTNDGTLKDVDGSGGLCEDRTISNASRGYS